ncbi:hypothetical protein J2Z42_002616 [Clostridium algifaecis]|uniref:Uncharacterized protein n=1 Tax=Clostridium algifaecis TaxID=1472040 RepID=A0ABS4KV35_9CLOT|nr:hypothetical protein [Clostridium algifaecis]
MRNIPNLITITIILGTTVLMFIKSFSELLFIIYFICGISNVVPKIRNNIINIFTIKEKVTHFLLKS